MRGDAGDGRFGGLAVREELIMAGIRSGGSEED